eukprot:8067611-Alexandrium_andersonii.AAC.1
MRALYACARPTCAHGMNVGKYARLRTGTPSHQCAHAGRSIDLHARASLQAYAGQAEWQASDLIG